MDMKIPIVEKYAKFCAVSRNRPPFWRVDPVKNPLFRPSAGDFWRKKANIFSFCRIKIRFFQNWKFKSGILPPPGECREYTYACGSAEAARPTCRAAISACAVGHIVPAPRSRGAKRSAFGQKRADFAKSGRAGAAIPCVCGSPPTTSDPLYIIRYYTILYIKRLPRMRKPFLVSDYSASRSASGVPSAVTSSPSSRRVRCSTGEWVYFLMSRIRGSFSSGTKVNATPLRLARPVRPMRCR